MNKIYLGLLFLLFIFKFAAPAFAHDLNVSQVEVIASPTPQPNLISIAFDYRKFFDFVKLGLEHIYTGYDHILFLLAIILVISNLKQALKTVTAFTLAHSLTLILSSLGLVALTSRIVEPIIALSIAYVAFENIFFKKSPNIFKRRWLLAFGFGLIHGLGFAGALAEINIPKDELLLDLLSFNIGIEIGQLTIIAAVLPILYYVNRFSRSPSLRSGVSGRAWNSVFISGLSLLIGFVGFFWFLERLGIMEILSQISLNTLFQSLPLLIIFFTFVLIQAGLFKRLQPRLWKVTRALLILAISVSITIAFIPGILNLRPKPVYAAVPSGVIVAWPSTNASIPSGWTRVTTLDSRYVKEIATSGTNPGATGGSASHDHAYGGGQHSDHGWSHSTAHSWPASAENTINFNHAAGTGPAFAFTHTHTPSDSPQAPTQTAGGPTNYDSATTEPQHLVVIFIKSDGTPTGIPNGALAFFNGSAPTGWSEYINARDRLLKGAAAGSDGGGTAGTGNSHTHTSAGHTHTIGTHTHVLTASGAGSVNTLPGGPSTDLSTTGHVHPTLTSATAAGETSSSSSESTNAGDMTPPWKKILPVENTSGGASQPNNVIAIWDGTLASIPTGWKLCDGTNCTVNLSEGKFVRGAANSGEVGNTGGATTHTHPGAGHSHSGSSHTHTVSGTFTASSNFITDFVTSSGTTGAHRNHEHDYLSITSGSGTGQLNSRSTSASANSSNDPVFTGVAYIQFQNQTPNAPTIMGSSPIPGSKPNKSATTISLQGTATDPDVADTVQIDWDYSSNSGGAWTNIGTTTLGAQSTTQTLSWNVSSLSTASTYRLRARTLDNGGAASGYTTQSADWTLTSGCSPPVTGDLTISASCAFPETVDGVDAGNMTINTSITLTINASQTVAFNSAKSITQNGSIAVSATGQIKQTNLWMIDSDADGWPSTAAQTAQDSSPGGTYRRRNLLQSDRIIDCNDAVSSSTNSC